MREAGLRTKTLEAPFQGRRVESVIPPRPAGFSDSKPKSAAANAGWNVFFMAWSSVVSLVLTPWLISSLGVGDYGIILLIWSFTGMLGIMNFGLGDATLRFVAHHYGRNDINAINAVIGSTLTIYIVISILVSFVLVVLAPVIAGLFAVPDESRTVVVSLVRVAAAIFALGIVSRTIGAVPSALRRYDITTKVNIGQSLLTFFGYALAITLNLTLLYFLLWDVAVLCAVLITQVVVVRRLLPGVALWPRLSRVALRELSGYSVYSFLGYLFHRVHRELAKLLIGGTLGPVGVAVVGVPDNLSQRVYGFVQSAGETLLPRFSAASDDREARELFWNSTWLASCAAVAAFIPFAVVLPDFLRLWVGAEFAERSGQLGQMIALSYVTQSVFVPATTLARGVGKPSIVTFVVFLSGGTMLVAGMLLIPRFALDGVGIAYLMASVPSVAGTIYIAVYYYGDSARQQLVRVSGVPLLIGILVFGALSEVRQWWGDPQWGGFVGFAFLATASTICLLFVVEELVGGQHSRTRLLFSGVSSIAFSTR